MIKSTNDYSIFKILDCNRDIKISHVATLMQSISICNMLKMNPILVNNDMHLIDGQHRLEAAKKLQIEVWYKVEEDLNEKSVVLLQNQRKWSLQDFIKYYVKTGKQEYLKLTDFLKKNELPLVLFLTSIYAVGRRTENVKHGGYKHNEEKCNIFLETHKKILHIKKFICERRPSIKNITESISFYRALEKFLSRTDIVYDILLEKIENKIEFIGMRSKKEGYYMMLLEMYNFKNRNPLPEEENNYLFKKTPRGMPK